MKTYEFQHYQGCNHNDPDNCSACALTTPTMIDHGNGVERMGINYAAWPLSYLDNFGRIPKEFMPYLKEELEINYNNAYLINLVENLLKHGYKPLEILRGRYE